MPRTPSSFFSVPMRRFLKSFSTCMGDSSFALFPLRQFEEQQAFEKSRKFLRQLEICFAENPSHHQKIIKVLQSCADCLPQEITEVFCPVLLPSHCHLGLRPFPSPFP